MIFFLILRANKELFKEKRKKLIELKDKVVEQFFKYVGRAYKFQKKNLFYTTFTKKKYNNWYLDLVEDLAQFYKSDLNSIKQRFDEIKGKLFLLLINMILLGKKNIVHTTSVF